MYRLVPPSTGSEKVVPEDPPKKEEKPVMVRTDCPHCDWWVSLPKHDADKALENHLKTCEKNPANAAPVIPPDPEIDIGVDVEQEPPKKPGVKKMTPEFPKNDKPKKSTSIFDDIDDLIEFGVGQIFGDTGTGKTAFCREIAEQAAGAGKKVVYWDSEGNMTRKQRASMAEHKNIEYILDRDWEDIRHMLPVTGEDNRTGQSIYSKTPKLKKCDLFILDSIGVPVLGIYGDLKQNQKGEALQGMQGLVYRLGAWAEKNDAVVIITNQPTSEMNKTKEQIAQGSPFGDKAKYFTKEILKIVIGERGEYKTVCHLLAWRSRSRVRGAMLGKVTISDKGTEIEFGG
jgi:RecA/RadA recombinase